jgi:large subunit ribosomal protein L22
MKTAIAHLRKERVSPQKARLIANQVRNLRVDQALNILKHGRQKSAAIIKKVLESAIANAEHNYGLDVDRLKISMIYINQGGVYKRMQARAKGRGSRITKPTSHITVQVKSF